MALILSERRNEDCKHIKEARLCDPLCYLHTYREHTILCAGTQEINNIFVFPNHFHHFHFWDQVRKIFVCSIICKERKKEVTKTHTIICHTWNSFSILWRKHFCRIICTIPLLCADTGFSPFLIQARSVRRTPNSQLQHWSNDMFRQGKRRVSLCDHC